MDQTQVMVGNFPSDVSAQELAAYLQRSLGLVDRCKVKQIYGSTPPHAFVQFMSAAVAREACRESECGRLNFHGYDLKIVPCTVQAKSKPSHEGMLSFVTSYQADDLQVPNAYERTSIYFDFNNIVGNHAYSLHIACKFLVV